MQWTLQINLKEGCQLQNIVFWVLIAMPLYFQSDVCY